MVTQAQIGILEMENIKEFKKQFDYGKHQCR
jgi:hypothetical protein